MTDTPDLTWHLLKCFSGGSEPNAPHVSACTFNHNGDFIAVGDSQGSILMLQRTPPQIRETNRRRRLPPVDYSYYCEFKSHPPEFDCLRSVEIPERINCLEFLKRPAGANFLFSANDKTIKLWKVYERDLMVRDPTDLDALWDRDVIGNTLRIPRLQYSGNVIVAKPRGLYANAHSSNINSVHPSCEGETFLSADEFRIHLWDINHPQLATNVVDIRLPNMDDLSDLTDVITCSRFHPSHYSEFLYATSLGANNLCDTRTRLDCTRPARVFKYEEPRRTELTEIISPISSIAFGQDGKYLFCRDLMTIKVWDMAMERCPIQVIPVHDQIRSHLAVMYETDCVFDRFTCAVSPTASHVMTGSYSNTLHIWSRDGAQHTVLETVGNRRRSQPVAPAIPEFEKKGLFTAWHPTENHVAFCTTTDVFLYTGVAANSNSNSSSSSSITVRSNP
eukprot:c15356_g1_i2.p1 GENE.c15356_g1_i2~~c15356_g1_i2.p1  ORF type:complete len:448 (+),score=85.35 c15356_g1_i2:57-1400(+)